MNRLEHDFQWKWHHAINEYSMAHKHLSWMYAAKDVADEVPRMAILFEMERNGGLPKVHRQCSHDGAGTPVEDNHLTCCLGVACRACPFLQAFDGVDVLPEQVDLIKAWTCATHILSEKGNPENSIDTSTGFIMTTDDVMYWSNVHASLAAANDPDEEPTE